MLRLYRTVRQRSLREIAKETGISSATLLRIETGRAMDAETLMRLWAWLLRRPAR
jgi:transcriptional regulator with XRE-family HTH domain